MIWILALVGVGLFVWWLFAPRRLQTLENIPAVVDKKFDGHDMVETTEDPREWDPIARKAAKVAGDTPAPGHGDSLTRDWPSEKREPHDTVARKEEGPLNKSPHGPVGG